MHHLYVDVMDVKKVSISDPYFESDDDSVPTERNMFSLRDLYDIRQVTITSHDIFKVLKNSLLCFIIIKHFNLLYFVLL